jgi:hypothetical protein
MLDRTKIRFGSDKPSVSAKFESKENRHRSSKHYKLAKDPKNIKAIVTAIDLATPNSYQSVAIN